MLPTRPPTSRRHAAVICAVAAATAFVCAALVSAAALVPAPPVVLPLIGAICIGCPLAVREDMRSSISVLRDPALTPLRRRHIGRLRRQLDRLPETEHPLGL
jgi:hypothetical protein